MNLRSSINLLLLGWLISAPLQGQVTFLGKPGFMTTPSASWEEERQLGLTFAQLPDGYSVFGSAGNKNLANFYSVRVSLISFMEVGFTIAHRPGMADKAGIGDRQLDFRFRFLKERKYWPSLVLGITPPGSVAPVFSHDYLVATKNLQTGIGNFRLSGGYGSPYVILKNPNQDNFLKALELEDKSVLTNGEYLSGFFGSLAYMPVSYGGVAVEYNTETFNAGAFIEIKKWLQLQGYTMEGKAWAFQVALQVPLDKAPRTLRRYEKNME